MTKKLHTLFIFTALLGSVVMLGGCNIGPFPFEFQFDTSASTAVLLLDKLPGGTQFSNLTTPEFQLCDLVGAETNLRNEISQSAGDFVANLLQIASIKVDSVTLTADANSANFEYIDQIEIDYRPEPGASPIELASLDKSSSGATNQLVLDPNPDVDFYKLIQDADSLPSGKCPSIFAKVSGTVPPVGTPTFAWTTTVKVLIYINL